MPFNPFIEKGKPLDQQWHPIKEVAIDPFKKDQVDEYTRLRIIAAYGMEYEQWHFYHNFARHTDQDDIRIALAQIRRTEDQHHSRLSFALDPEASVLEVTIAVEHLAVDLTANAAREEPDPYVKQVFNYGLLEDFDHLFRYSELLDRLEHKDASKITKGLVEIKPGGPTWLEHLHPFDTLRNFYDARRADPLTKLHAHTIPAAEQYTRAYYAAHAWEYKDREARGLFAEIGEIEEQHVSQYEAIIDPRPSWLQMAIDHEYTEIYNYFGFIQAETDPRFKRIWEEHLADELEHLHVWGRLLKKYETMEMQQLWPANLPKPISYQPAKDYVNQVLASELDLRADGKDFVMKDKLPSTWPSYKYQQMTDIKQDPSTHLLAKGEHVTAQ